MNKDLVFKGIVVATLGGVAVKAVRMIKDRKFKQAMEEFDEILECEVEEK